MEHKKLSLFIGLYILVISVSSEYDFTTSRPGKTDGCCLGFETRSSVIELKNYPDVTNETECTNLCSNNEPCVGLHWESNSGPHDDDCKLFIRMNVKQRSLVNCADNHVQHCWKVKAGVHQAGGTYQKNITDEADCKRICVDHKNCTSVVWNINRTECWILLHKQNAQISPHKHLVNHWTIVRDLPKTFQKAIMINPNVPDRKDEIFTQQVGIALSALLGVWTLIIIGISIYALKLKKCCSTQKKVDKVKVVDVAKVVEAKVNDYGEAKEDDDESYIDYQDLRRLENPPTTCEEEGCEYTAMELENMKEMEDDDNIYYNEDQ